MSKKTYALVTSIIGGVATIAMAIVTFCQPHYAVAIVASIGIVNTATSEVLNLFVEGK